MVLIVANYPLSMPTAIGTLSAGEILAAIFLKPSLPERIWMGL
jgi:hypothetical protein